MTQSRVVLVISMVVTGAASALWGLAADHPNTALLRMGAVASVVLSGVSWYTFVLVLRDDMRRARDEERSRQIDREYRRRETAMLRIADRLAGPPTQPMQRLPEL